MKPTGIVRRIDELGRIVLPVELRKTYDIHERDSIEIFTDDDNIILKKYNPTCTFCGEAMNLSTFKGKLVCPKCVEDLKRF